MYLANVIIDGRMRFIIRESYRDGDVFKSRNLFDLGKDPARFIVYPGGNSFYIDDTVLDGLSSAGRRLSLNASSSSLKFFFSSSKRERSDFRSTVTCSSLRLSIPDRPFLFFT